MPLGGYIPPGGGVSAHIHTSRIPISWVVGWAKWWCFHVSMVALRGLMGGLLLLCPILARFTCTPPHSSGLTILDGRRPWFHTSVVVLGVRAGWLVCVALHVSVW